MLIFIFVYLWYHVYGSYLWAQVGGRHADFLIFSAFFFVFFSQGINLIYNH